MDDQVGFTLWIGCFVCIAVFLLLRHRRKRNLPPGPWGFPVLGYLPFLGKEPHQDLYSLSKKYGDVFGIYLGTTYVVVVTDYATAKNLLKQFSTSGRPKDFFMFLPDGAGLANLSGSDWVEQRRYTVQKMKNLGFGKSIWEKLVQTEVRSFLDLITEYEGRPVDIHQPLSASISNNVMSLVSGHRLPMGDPKRDIVDSGVECFQQLYNQSGLITTFPKLYQVAIALGLVSNAKEKLKAIGKMNRYVRANTDGSMPAEENSYIQEYLKEIEKNKESNSGSSFNVRNLIGNVQSLIIAGSDTTKVSIYWLLLAMASYQDIQDKVRSEIDSVLGKDEVTSWEDRYKLPYCTAAIMEGQRWRTIAPLNLLHSTNQDMEIRDYVIPKGSSIISMIWAFHMDPKNWKDPEEFCPERFLDENGSVVKKTDNYAPFSFGKRLCIGETVANIELFLYFVGIMQRFRILPPSEGASPDLTGIVGLTFQPTKQKLRYVPR